MTEDKPEELKPCPFCGESVEIEVFKSTVRKDYADYEIDHFCGKVHVHVFAIKHRIELVEAWNTRAGG